MATIQGKMTDGPFGRGVLIQWTPMATGDVGTGVYVGNLKDLSVKAEGTATAVAMEGSMDGTNWAAFTTAVPVANTVTGIPVVPAYLRPNATTATAVTVTVSGKRDNL